MNLKSKLFIILILPFFVQAQMPDTEVWLFEVKKDKAGVYSAQKPVNVSQRKGYDNQPSFSADGKSLYYTSDANGQTDLYSFSLKSKKAVRLTNTQESEYSPRPVPGQNLISAVVVEKDSAQRLYFYNNLDGAYSKKLDTDSIGYYYFLNADTVIFYKLTEPHSLRWRTMDSAAEHFLGHRPTRCFQPINRHAFVYGLKDSAHAVYYSYDFSLKRATKIAGHESGSEDLFLHPALGLLIANKQEVLRYNAGSKAWEVLFNFSSQGITKITRFVFDPSGRFIALVDNPQ